MKKLNKTSDLIITHFNDDRAVLAENSKNDKYCYSTTSTVTAVSNIRAVSMYMYQAPS